ncbi:hypothetical protein KQH82_02790 [bacterium]|nr:hypothetical protein [bacterium]
MRNSKLWIVTFVLAMALGIGLSLVVPQKAYAIMCDSYPGGTNWTSIPCHCGDNPEQGVIVERWLGYWNDGSYCGYYTYCSLCPPRNKKGPYPYEQPPDPELP